MNKKNLNFVFLFVVLPILLFAGAGNDLSFDGSNDYVGTNLDIQRSIYANLTMSAWVYPTSNSSGRHQVLSDDDGSFDRSLLRENNSWAVFTGSGCWLPGASVTYNTWQHVAVVYSTTDIKFYLDGVEYSYGTEDKTGSTNNLLRIGSNPGYGEYWAGEIDEVRIWTTALSQATIQDWMNKPLDNTHPNWANLLAYWKFDEGSGQSAGDSSSNSNTGTLGSTSGSDGYDPVWGASDAPLPVVLSDFYANFIADELAIIWTTQSEENLNGWNIYKANSNNFEDSAKLNGELISATGNTTQSTTYRFIDTTENINHGETYYYWLESIDFNGTTILTKPINYTIPEENNPDTPNVNDKYTLSQNFPNPFNPTTEIKFKLENNSNAKLEIYNIKGQKITTLFNGYATANQEITKVWNATTSPSGVYFYKLTIEGKVITKKMILMK